jgi:hypothetical protein
MPPVPDFVAGLTKIVTPTITVSTGAYTAGDSIGGKITLQDAMRVNGINALGSGILSGITLLDRSNQKPELEIFIFESHPAAATITDNDAFVFSTDDLKVIGKVVVATADWTTTDSKAVAEMSNLNIVVKAVGEAHLYAALVATGAPDFVATDDFQARFKFFQD